MAKYTVKRQEELFAMNCKIINLQYEYSGYSGLEKWAIVSELTEEELQTTYPDIISRYVPFIRLSVAQSEPINEFNRNNEKYEKRAKRTYDVYGYEDDLSEHFHREMITPFVDPFEEEERKIRRSLEIEKVRKSLIMLKPIQRRRLIKSVLLRQTLREIAAEEGVSFSAVAKSVNAAKKNFKKIFESL